MRRSLLPVVLQAWTRILVLALPATCWGEPPQASWWAVGISEGTPEPGKKVSAQLPSARLWRPSSPWESGLPPDAVVGSWEAVRLWELADGEPMPFSPGESSLPGGSGFFAWPGASPRQELSSGKPFQPDQDPLLPGLQTEGAGPREGGSASSSGQPGPVLPIPPAGLEETGSGSSSESGPAREKKPASQKASDPQAPPSEVPAGEKKPPREQETAAVRQQPSQDDAPPAQKTAEEVPPGKAEVEVESSGTSWFAWPPVLEHWDARFKAGMDGTAGNNQRFTTRLGLDVDHKDSRFVWSSQLDYVVTTSSGEQIENEAIWDGRFERLTKDNPTGWFVHGNVEYDRFTAFDVRITLDGGLSYYFVRAPDLSFKGRMAGGTSREFGVPGAEYVPEFSYGLELQWKPHKRYELKAKTDVFSDVRDFSDFRATTRATWRVQVDSSDRVGLQFELLNRYDSTPNGKKKYDLTYSVQLVWDL